MQQNVKWNIHSPGWKSMLSNSRWTASSILNSSSHANRKIIFKCWTEYSEMVLSVKLLISHNTPVVFTKWQSQCLKAQYIQFVHVFECQCTGWLRDLASCCLGLFKSNHELWNHGWMSGETIAAYNKLLLAGCWVVRSTYHWFRSTYHWFVSLSTCHSVTLSSDRNDL